MRPEPRLCSIQRQKKKPSRRTGSRKLRRSSLWVRQEKNLGDWPSGTWEERLPGRSVGSAVSNMADRFRKTRTRERSTLSKATWRSPWPHPGCLWFSRGEESLRAVVDKEGNSSQTSYWGFGGSNRRDLQRTCWWFQSWNHLWPRKWASPSHSRALCSGCWGCDFMHWVESWVGWVVKGPESFRTQWHQSMDIACDWPHFFVLHEKWTQWDRCIHSFFESRSCLIM